MELFDKKFVYLEWDDVLVGKKVFLADTLLELKSRVENNPPRSTATAIKHDDGAYPFLWPQGIAYAMAYYDPNYECKVAYARGQMIQVRRLGSDDWENCKGTPLWLDKSEYRIKPKEEKPGMWTVSTNDDGIVSIIPTRAWNKIYGRQLINGTREECRTYVVNNCRGDVCVWYEDLHTPDKPKRRMTNRELARWLAEGRGEVLQNTITFISWNYLVENKDKPVSDNTKIRGWDETEWHDPLVEG